MCVHVCACVCVRSKQLWSSGWDAPTVNVQRRRLELAKSRDWSDTGTLWYHVQCQVSKTFGRSVLTTTLANHWNWYYSCLNLFIPSRRRLYKAVRKWTYDNDGQLLSRRTTNKSFARSIFYTCPPTLQIHYQRITDVPRTQSVIIVTVYGRSTSTSVTSVECVVSVWLGTDVKSRIRVGYYSSFYVHLSALSYCFQFTTRCVCLSCPYGKRLVIVTHI